MHSVLHPQTSVMGTIYDIFRATSPLENRKGRTARSGALYPTLSALGTSARGLQRDLLGDKYGNGMPRAGILPEDTSAPWATCAPPLETVQCDTNVPTSCPDPTVCVQVPDLAAGKGICLSTADILAPAPTPCYRSDMCDTFSHCLAEVSLFVHTPVLCALVQKIASICCPSFACLLGRQITSGKCTRCISLFALSDFGYHDVIRGSVGV